MRLDEIITPYSSFPSDQIVPQLEKILDNANVTVNSWGTRLVSAEGYEGTVNLDIIASVYRHAETFSKAWVWPSSKLEKPTLEERVRCYELSKKICSLYDISDEILDTSFRCSCCLRLLNNFLTHEFTRNDRNFVRSMQNGQNATSLFQFSPDEFRKYWPNVEPVTKLDKIEYVDSFGNGDPFQSWVASEAMIRSALAKKNQ